MSTRKLILTALICGLAIMLAGGVKLLQVASDESEVPALSAGETATLADMTVSVESVERSDAMTIVTVTMVGVEGADAAEGWFMASEGEVLTPMEPSGGAGSDDAGSDDGKAWCSTTAKSETRRCDLAFPAVEKWDWIIYRRADVQSRWLLP